METSPQPQSQQPPPVVAAPVSELLLDAAVVDYGELCAEARSLGIPEHALPQRPVPLTVAGLRASSHHLQLIIASRLSSNL